MPHLSPRWGGGVWIYIDKCISDLKRTADCDSTAVEDKVFHTGMVLTQINIYMRLLGKPIAYNCEYDVNAEIDNILPYH